MILQHAMLATEMSFAEAAVADYALGDFFAFFGVAADFFIGHATSYWESEFEQGGRGDGEGG